MGKCQTLFTINISHKDNISLESLFGCNRINYILPQQIGFQIPSFTLNQKANTKT
jgi:hypothetical protein